MVARAIKLLLCALLCSTSAAMNVLTAKAEPETPLSVHISSLKVSSTSEYIEIYNSDNTQIDIEGWTLEYSNLSGSNIKTVVSLDGTIEPGQYRIFVSSGFSASFPAAEGVLHEPLAYSGFADTGGFIRLYRPASQVGESVAGDSLVDEIGWISSSKPSELSNTFSYTGPKSLHRCVDAAGLYVDRGDVRIDYYALDTPLVSSSGTLCADLVVVPDDDPVDEGPDGPELNTCDGLLLSEVLPNPNGTDAGNEFIELYNSLSEAAPLIGCRIELGNGDYFVFTEDIEVAPESYHVVTDDYTKLTLINSQSQTIYLLGEDMAEVSTTTYPADLDDDQSWAIFDDEYATTYTPTPGTVNVHLPDKPCEAGYVRSTETGRCNIVVSNTETIECDPGYERNPDTNRCKKITNTILAPCAQGQERNPATNRCRSVPATVVLAACKEGQERNPDTNRCRSVDTGTELIPCAPGQERNPDTNRCRNVQGSITGDDVLTVVDIPTDSHAPTFPVGPIGIGAVSYVFYEWRTELLKLIRRVIRR